MHGFVQQLVEVHGVFPDEFVELESKKNGFRSTWRGEEISWVWIGDFSLRFEEIVINWERGKFGTVFCMGKGVKFFKMKVLVKVRRVENEGETFARICLKNERIREKRFVIVMLGKMEVWERILDGKRC